MVRSDLYKKISLGLIAFLVLMYLRQNTALLSLQFLGGFNTWVEPIIWGVMSLLIVYAIPKKHLKGQVKHKQTVYIWAFNAAVTFIIMSLMAGFFDGFGKSPYDHSLMGILQNSIIIGSALVGQELVRAYVLNSTLGRESKWPIPLMIGLMTFINLPLVQLTNMTGSQDVMTFVANIFLPTLSENMLATYLVVYAGPLASVIYLGLVEAFEWLSPILPDLSWLTKGMIGMSVPIGALIMISQAYMKLTGHFKAYREKETKVYEWLPVTVICVLIIWFTVGVFPIYPSAIATGSMKPGINPGDVVLVKKLQDRADIEALQIGDIIQFKKESILVNHRIIDIVEEEDEMKYRTKGDNNSAQDADLVAAEDIKGTIVEVIPKIGWPTLILKNSNKEAPPDIEF
ncbi:MAG: signal peptidase I [Clostridiales bacterium]|nr:signal peptidase I [Clostridiales bacterium]MDU6972697.1 signal peptidase I [Clostridiales bacterium]